MSNSNFALDEEIELKKILQIISKSKKIVVFIIIICTLLGAGYAHFLKPTTYTGFSRISIGEINDKPFLDLKETEHIIKFIYGYDFVFTPHNNKFLELEVKANSNKSANSKITELTQFILDASEEEFNKNSANINIQLKLIQDSISIIDGKINAVDKELNSLDHDSAFLFELNMQKKNLQFEQKNLKNTEMRLLETQNSRLRSTLYEPISIAAQDKKEGIVTFFGFLFGIVLSIILIFIRSNLDKNN